MARSGGRWRDLPERCGPFERAKKRYYRWIEMGVRLHQKTIDQGGDPVVPSRRHRKRQHGYDSRAPLSVEAVKRTARRAPDLAPEEGDVIWGEEQRVLRGSNDHKSAVAAFRERRDPSSRAAEPAPAATHGRADPAESGQHQRPGRRFGHAAADGFEGHAAHMVAVAGVEYS